MNARFRPLFVVSAALSLAGCDKPLPPAAGVPPAPNPPAVVEADPQLADARDALQRQALEIETKTALMDKQLAEMEQALKARENAELRDSLDALKQQNETLRVQADAARRQSNAITQRIAATVPPVNVAPPPVVQSDYSLFYEGLSPYGRWFDVNGYGYCWRPTITVAGWRPYLDGCWVWSSLGWAWQSNEPFGWATYHYGRWVNLASYGWVWVPGSEWAPAWVAWRQSRDCVGWAPLPPQAGACTGVYRDCDAYYGLGPTSYVFINNNQFVSPTYINVYAPVTQRTTIFQHSVNVTQIVPNSGRGHGFGHGHVFAQQGGPPRAQMEQVCGQQVPQRQLQTMPAGQMPAQHPHGRPGNGSGGPASALAVVEVPALAAGAHMRRPDIREHIERPAPVNGFADVPQQVAAQIQQSIARERETAAVQRPPAQGGAMQGAPGHGAPMQGSPMPGGPMQGHERPHDSGRHHGGAPAVAGATPGVNAPAQETVRPAVAAENPLPAQAANPVAGLPVAPAGSFPHGGAVEQTRPGMPVAGAPHASGTSQEHRGEHHRAPGGVAQQPTTPEQPAVMPAGGGNKVAEQPAGAAPGAAAIPAAPEQVAPAAAAMTPAAGLPQTPAASIFAPQPQLGGERRAAEQANANAAAAEAERARVRAAQEQAQAQAQATEQAGGMQHRRPNESAAQGMGERRGLEQAAAAAEAEKTRLQAAAVQQQQEAQAAQQQQRMAADQAAAEADKVRRQAEGEAMQLRQQQEQQTRALAEKRAADQAAFAAEGEKARMQAANALQQQQESFVAQQQRMQAERAAAENEKTRRLAEAAAMQQQQQEQAAQQRAAAERMANEQAAAAEAARVQQAQAAAMQQRQQEEAAAQRAAQEQQMRAQQEAAQRAAQEQAQRQAEEQARRQQEAEMQRQQEQARRAAEEQMRAQQEAAQRAAQEQQMRAQQEAAQRAAQEQAQRQAEEQMRAQQEAARRVQEEAQRAAAEAAQRAAAEAARNQPHPATGS